MWTKFQLLDEAFGDIGLASYIFDIEAEEQEKALRQLDMMMSNWGIKGIRVGYQLSQTPDDSSINKDSGLPEYAIEAVTKALAIRLAPKYNKMPSPLLLAQAKESYNTLLTAISTIPEVQNTSILPRGTGNRYHGRMNQNFYQETDDLTANNSTLDL